MHNDFNMGATSKLQGKRLDRLSTLIGARLHLAVKQKMRELNQQKIDLLMLESGAKERELEVLNRRVVFDTNEINQLNMKIMLVNRKIQENDPKSAIDNDGGVSSCDED